MTQDLTSLIQQCDLYNKVASDASRSSKETETHRRDDKIQEFNLKADLNRVQGLIHNLDNEYLPVISQLKYEVPVLGIYKQNSTLLGDFE